jgi:5'-3' exonuclease
MGINQLNKFLRNNCNEIYEEVDLKEYAFQKVAIDISLYLCKFKATCGDTWLSSFLNMVTCLRRNEIHCVFIYDTGAPIEKQNERDERAAQRDKLETQVSDLEDALNKFNACGEIDPILIELNEKMNKKQPQQRLLRQNNRSGIDMNLIEEKITKMRRYILDISPEDFELTKQLFTILDVPFYDAPLEAETMCADICKRGLVDAVMSEDTDVLAYGAPIFLSKVNFIKGKATRIVNAQMLEALELTSPEFLDFCIMCGTDYNKNIPRIGPEKSYKLIKQYRNIEAVQTEGNIDVSILNHVRGRDIFVNYEKFQIDFIPYCGTPDFNKLREFVFRHNLRLDVNGMVDAFTKTVIFFEE